MADKEGDGEPADEGRAAGQQGEKDGETAALMRQLLAALEKRSREVRAGVSCTYFKRPFHPLVGVKSKTGRTYSHAGQEPRKWRQQISRRASARTKERQEQEAASGG